MSISEGDARITIADLFRVMSDIQANLAKALTKLEVIDARNVNADERHRDFEQRIRKLESAKAKMAGVAATVGTIAGILSGYFASLRH